MKKVIESRSRNNSTGKDIWHCKLSCGHEQRKPRRGAYLRKAPTKLACPSCESPPGKILDEMILSNSESLRIMGNLKKLLKEK